MSATHLLLVHAAATCALAGLIWTMQCVHYPLFAQVGAAQFRAFHERHLRLTTLIVTPLVLLEAATAAGALWLGMRESWFLASLVALPLIWLSTFLVQVPLHARLTGGFDAAVHARLVATNWIRTALWTLRAGLLAALLA